MRKSIRGMPWLEILMWAVIAGIALGVLSSRIIRVLELTEKTAVETAVMNMRSGLRLEKARRIAAGQSLGELAGRMPLEFLRKRGEGDDWRELARQMKSIDWIFEAGQPVIAYRPRRSQYLKLQAGAADKTLVWRTQARAADGSDVEIVLVTPYEWF
jgi:hypothetical protein